MEKLNPLVVIENYEGISETEKAVLRERFGLPHPEGYELKEHFRKYHPIHKMILDRLRERGCHLAAGSEHDGVAIHPGNNLTMIY